jgi:LuxR family maltose regulon positive regulatory protein
MRVILLTRADPPLALARLRVQGRLLELRAADLRFSSAEVAAFFNCALPYRLPQRAIQTLIERIEGWPAGLRLAALSLQELPEAEAQGFVRMFSGAERYVFHYLLEEVLQLQPPRKQTFLLQTSILRSLHPDLCAAVTGYDDARQILDQMAQDNLFILRLEGVADWFRYHRLFAGALRNRLEQTEPALIPELRRRASAWYQSQGLREGVPERMLPAMMSDRYQFELDDDALPIDPLTEREAEILALIDQGLSNQQIADRLVIGTGTVKGHINHLLSKLDAHSRTDALAKARRLGLLQK